MQKIKNLKLKCGHCGAFQHSQVIIGTDVALEKMVVSNAVQQCHACGKDMQWDRARITYEFEDGSGGWMGADFPDNKA